MAKELQIYEEDTLNFNKIYFIDRLTYEKGYRGLLTTGEKQVSRNVILYWTYTIGYLVILMTGILAMLLGYHFMGIYYDTSLVTSLTEGSILALTLGLYCLLVKSKGVKVRNEYDEENKKIIVKKGTRNKDFLESKKENK